MMDSDRLKVPSGSERPVSGDRTPSRRGHRHKRSFAISQDLEFLKQPPGTPPAKSTNWTTSPVRNDLSPRFFMSEEPTYSHDVPNAIIDLDDALTTKPKSFASHRRAESAPANLILPFRPDSSQPLDKPLCIEEEDSEDDSEYILQDALMSPLRAKSQSPFLKGTPSTVGSPKSMKKCQFNNNTLKINKQKERYLNYTKQLPAASPQMQPHYYMQEASSTSLSSGLTSGANTPAVTINTPNTPIFSVLKFSGKSPSPRKMFNFESQVYDLPSTSSSLHEQDKDIDDDTLTCTDTNATYEPVHRRTKSAAAYESSEGYRIPPEILLGEPGGSADLSRAKLNFREEKSLNNSAKVGNVSSVAEPRSVSDSVVVHEGVPHTSTKRRGKRHILLSIFSRFRSSK